MSPRTLREPLVVYRIGDPLGQFPVYSGDGAALQRGRWHRKGQAVIYASEHYSNALLEILVRRRGLMPPNQHYIEITIPQGTTYEEVTKDILPGWDTPSAEVACDYGASWLEQRRTGVLIVPSYVAPVELNVLINPAHPHAKAIRVGREKPVRWDARLFGAAR